MRKIMNKIGILLCSFTLLFTMLPTAVSAEEEAVIQSIEFASPIVYEGMYAAYGYNYSVTFSDGTTQHYSSTSGFYHNRQTYGIRIDPVDNDILGLKAGETYQALVRATKSGDFVFSTEYSFTVKAINSLEIQDEEGLVLTIHQTDGETVTANAKFLKISKKEDGKIIGLLYTDKMALDVTFNFTDDYKDVTLSAGGATSNRLSSSQWLKTAVMAEPFRLFPGGIQEGTLPSSFDGTMTRENADSLILAAYMYRYINNLPLDYQGQYPRMFEPATMKQYIRELFSVPDMDLSLSTYYEPDLDKVLIYLNGAGGGPHYIPEVISNNQEKYMQWDSSYDDTKIKISFSDNGKLSNVVAPVLPHAGKKRLMDATIELKDRYEYTGEKIEPVKVTYDGKTLEEGKDYSTYYQNNTEIGTANVTISGMGDYTGYRYKTFRIVPAATNKVKKASTITLKNKTLKYNKKARKIGKATVTGSKGKVTYTYYVDKACKKKTNKKNSGAKKKGTAPKLAGVYYVKATVAADSNFKAATSKAAKLTVKPKVKVTWKNVAGYWFLYPNITGLKGNAKSKTIGIKSYKVQLVNQKNKKLRTSDTYKKRMVYGIRPGSGAGAADLFQRGQKYKLKIKMKMVNGSKITISSKWMKFTH